MKSNDTFRTYGKSLIFLLQISALILGCFCSAVTPDDVKAPGVYGEDSCGVGGYSADLKDF